MNIKNKKGFTIIELIVVIAIIAILAAIVMVNVVQYIGKSKDAAVEANIDTMKTNVGAFNANDKGGDGTYETFNVACTGGAVAPACNPNIIADHDSVFAAIKQNDAGGADPAEKYLSTTWCISAPLTAQSGSYYCSDSNGTNSAGAKVCDSTSGLCQ